MNFTKYYQLFVLITLTILISFTFWFSFYLNLPQKFGFPKSTLETVYSNFDGPNYMVISKCGYDKRCIATNFSLPLPLEYYPAHLPGYPLLIKYFSFYTTTPKAMLLSSLFGSVLLSISLYYFFQLFIKPKKSFIFSLLFLFFPARMLVLRLVGAPESWFIAFTLLSVIFYYRQKYIFSAVFGCLSLLLKSPGILLFMAYLVLIIIDYFKSKQFIPLIKIYFPYILIPLTALIIFWGYYIQTGDFLAYFHSGDNIHLNLLPYQVFISNHRWINTIWLEDVVYIFLIAFIALAYLYKKFKLSIVTIYPAIFVLASIFVAHRDISRYIAPVYPFVFLAFSKFLSKKQILIILVLLIPAVILFTINFIIGNSSPISDWTPYL